MIDIYSKAAYPNGDLSNFAKHSFKLDGVHIASMEGFLQSLKYRTEKEQRYVCRLSGKEAKMAGSKKFFWKISKTVYWKDQKYNIFSDELQQLIDRAYEEMYKQSNGFRKALKETGTETLVHTIGKHRMDQTILTEYNFIRRLEKLRGK